LAVEFNPDEHVYRHNGRELAGVTDVLDSAGHYRGLKHVDEDALEASRVRGLKVHRALEQAHAGELDRTGLDEETAGYVDAFDQFHTLTAFEADGFEEPIGCRCHRIAGTPDAWGVMRGKNGGREVLIDFKTSAASSGKAMFLQLAAYRHLVLQKTNMLYEPIGVELKPDGRFRLHRTGSRWTFAHFLKALRRYRSGRPEQT